MSGFYGAGSTRYKNTRLAYTGSVSDESVRGITSPAAGSRAFAVSATDGSIVPMRRVVIRNKGAQAVTIKLVTLVLGATGVTEVTGDPIPLEIYGTSGDSIDTEGMVTNISDVLVTAVNTDVIEIFQQYQDELGGA